MESAPHQAPGPRIHSSYRRRALPAAFAFLLLLFLPVLSHAQVDSLISPGDLSKAHAKFSGIKNCSVCHGPDNNVVDSKCLDCHKELAAQIRDGKGFHKDKKSDCATCHSEHLGKDFDIRPFDKKKFNHADTGWPLQGLHAKVMDCAACHKTRSFVGLKTDCASCHKDPHQGRLPNCAQCHSVDRPMKQVTFDHATTAYPLTGAHSSVACMKCHAKQVFKGTPFANCASCHTDPHKASLGANCTSCHTTQSWKQPKVEHKAFPLIGKHASVQCAACHPNGQWKLNKPFAKCADCHKDPHLGQFAPRDCESCHNVQGFKPAKFSHDSFKLEAAHAIPCAKCHTLEKGTFPAGKGQAVRYKPIASDCVTCHKDIHKGQFGTKCETCHTVTTFKLQGFDHSKTRFPLDKAHANVKCADCHKTDPKTNTIRYKPLDLSCSSCHVKAHMGQLSNKCEQCHKPDGVHFDHATAAFPLTGKHVNLTCDKCHKTEKGVFPMGSGEAIRYKPLKTACASCHEDEHRGQFLKDCVACHNTEAWKPSVFNHARSEFPLLGAHSKAQCSSCHKMETFNTPPPPVQRVRYHPIPMACATCHKDPHQGRLGTDCASCHTVDAGWKIVSRAFHKTGKFPLDGSHLNVKCEDCHLNGVIKGTPTRCYDCHWIRRQDDPYRTQLGSECVKCHNTTTWTSARFDHAADAHVPLNASHQGLACDSCHKSGTFTGSVDCYSCHREDYDNTKQPNHRASGFPTTCENCHRPGDNTWQGPAFNHSLVFPLVGVHATLQCSSCHKNGVTQGTPRTCYGCHKTDYDATQNPNHASSGFPTDCEACHKATDPNWNQGKFNHDSFFPLVGTHKTLACNTCHKNGVYQGTPRNCYGCHKADYDATRDPNHVAAGFPTTCENCHNPSNSSWNTTFDHNKVFPLVGTHKTLACSSCHKNGVYKGTPRQCYGCHKADYDATKNPNHVSAGFPTTCQNCHNPSNPSWNTAFDHSKVYPLVGTHRTLACTACHKNGVYKGTPRQCYGCHKTQYDATNSPNHAAAGFPTTCDSCHRASDPNWNASFDHNKFYALVGMHKTAACSACHINNRYKGTPKDCYACHKAQYDATKNPNHASAGFPIKCDACHKASDPDWNRAVFNHNSFFPLAGRHATAPCEACHKNGVYKGTPRTCYGCHQADYNSTNNPNHRAAGFPTTCDSCHKYTDSSWDQGVFNHTWFPITSGRHAGNPCSACHTNPSNYAVFTCLTCHQKGETDSHHTEVGGYRYDSNACYSCHPRGTAGD